MPKNQET